MKLSDLYIAEQGSPDVWNDKELTEAYLNYFLPLNIERAKAVWGWANDIGFTKLFQNVVELGSGPGTLQLAAAELDLKWPWHCVEAGESARKIHKKFADEFGLVKPQFQKSLPKVNEALFTCSYVLNETNLPDEALQYDSIMIIEPSTQSASRKLMELRQKLINAGYHIWGPCTHKSDCPLLKHSKKDWCHFRIHWQPTEKYLSLEKELPIKNRTLTLSYLMASRKKPPHFSQERPARIIGDTLYEKGKTRQALCRGDRREFLSWLKRDGEAQPYQSGQLIEMPKSHTIKGNEIRLSTSDE